MSFEDRSVLAGELALGVLDGEERAAAMRLVIGDRDFAREVERWRAQLAELFARWPEATVDDAVEARVLAATGGRGEPDRAGVVRSIGSRPAERPVRRWQAATGAATALAAGLLGLLVLRPDPAPPPAPSVSQPIPLPAPAPLIAVLTPTEGRRAAPVAAVFEPGTGVVRLAGAVAVPDRRIAELWSIGSDGTPFSLGLLSDGAAPRLTVATTNRARLARDVVLAISIEPPGGSPTGAPTGPVIATGALTTV